MTGRRAASEPAPLKQGLLEKQTNGAGGWHRRIARWFVLDGRALSYYASEQAYRRNDAARACFDLTQVSTSVVAPSLRTFRLSCQGVQIDITAPTELNKRDWIESIRRATSDIAAANDMIGTTARQPPLPDRLVVDDDDDDGSTTVHGLVQRLLEHDSAFERPFLLYRRSFLTSAALFDELSAAFEAASSTPDCSRARSMRRRRARVLEVLRRWLESYPSDFDPVLAQRCRLFVDRALQASPPADDLRPAIDRAIAFGERRRDTTDDAFGDKTTPRYDATLSIVDVAAADIATWMTATDWSLFVVVRPPEFVDRAWASAAGAERAPRLRRLIRRFNDASFWAASLVLQESIPSTRQRVMSRLIKAASCCLDLCNYFGAFAIAIGLSLTPVFRLRTDWDAMTTKTSRRFQRLQAITSDADNFSEYRRAIRLGLGKAQIPHIAITLKDLFQLDSLDTFSDGARRCINWARKFERQWAELSIVLRCQQLPYRMVWRNGDADRWLDASFVHDLLTEDQMFERSRFYLPATSGT